MFKAGSEYVKDLNTSHVLPALAFIFYAVFQRPCNLHHILETLHAFLCQSGFKRKVRRELDASRAQGNVPIRQ